MIFTEEEYLAHYGTPRHSGRYPWGSGKTPEEHGRLLTTAVAELKKQGLSDKTIADGFGITTTQLRAQRSIARNQQRQDKINQAQRLKDKGYSPSAIGKRMNINESSVRALLEPGSKDRADILTSTASMLRDQVAAKKYIQIGSGVENSIGVSKTRLDTAVAMLQEEGYTKHYLQIPQLGTSHLTTLKVLAAPGTPWKEVYQNRADIRNITESTQDGGRTYLGIHPPLSIDPSRIGINYKEDGGDKADGVIFVRPGVDDVSLGKNRYAQVRVMVGDSHYLKGMAVYKDGLPKGTDLVFNTNKSNTGNKLAAMKELKRDQDGNVDGDNPFGSVIKAGGQQVEKDASGNQKVTSVMNIVNEEGDWGEWSKNLSSQMLSKQSPSLAKQQLDMTYERKRNELDGIEKLTNPAVKQKLLDSFADDADSSAVHLKAAALPRQASHVILPVDSMKPTEIYAPNHRNGERVALIRYPHAGTFEIPELTVNNNNPEAKRLIGNSEKVDAIGIHHSVAERLSGADFDGDTVLVIPNNRGDVKTTPALDGLKNFDPKSSYPPYDGMRTIDGGTWDAKTGKVDYISGKKGSTKQQEMGNVTNLISDMTLNGANTTELAQAVRHSMVVIDAEKHSLDYKSSAINNGIAELKEKYQGGKGAGAATLITRASSEYRVAKRKPRSASEGGAIDKATGKKVFTPTGESYVDKKTGKVVDSIEKSTKLAETDDAHSLVSDSNTKIEQLYADHSNRLKALANEARKESVNLDSMKYSKSAKKVYSNEVESLNAKLNIALKNAPLEKQAQLLAGAVVAAKRASNPDMDDADLKKIKGQALNEMRLRTGAKKQEIEITPEEWNAIQAGAITHSKLKQILNNADIEKVKQLATPKTALDMTSTDTDRAKSMLESGYTQAQVADQLGVSVSTLKRALKGDD